MTLEAHRQDWEDLARVDPYWAILSSPDKRFGRWDPDEFFRTGEAEIDRAMARAAELGHPRAREEALDFGCGVGRLTRALARRFGRCVGLDISEEMIARARELNAGVPHCEFRVSARADLGDFPDGSFDLLYSTIVLQHLPGRDLIRKYIAEFVRTLRPGGLLIFQLPAHIPLRHRLQFRRRAYSLLRALGAGGPFLYRTLGMYPIRMNFIPEDSVTSLLDGLGARTLHVERETTGRHVSCTYYVTLR